MKTSIKTIMTSALAVGFIACSDNESASTAPQDSVSAVSDTIQILPDTTKLIEDYASSETAEVPESSTTVMDTDSIIPDPDIFHKEGMIQHMLDQDNFNNMVTIDCPTGEKINDFCGESRLTTINGKTLVHSWMGTTGYFGCETDSSSLARYSVSISSGETDVKGGTAKKILVSNNELINSSFKSDCEYEKGAYSKDNDGVQFCIVDVPPTDSADLNNISYTDPYWKKYAGTIINDCTGQVFYSEPETSAPETNLQPIIVPDGSQASTNWIKTGECKANALVKKATSKYVAIEWLATITMISDGSYEIMIPDVEDDCEIYTGVVRYLAGEDLIIQYDPTCERHEEYYHPTDTTDIATVLTLYQYDESCSTAIVSDCFCTSDHYFQVNEELLKGAKYVHFKGQKYTIENPLEL